MNRLLAVTLPLSLMALAIFYLISNQPIHSQEKMTDQTVAPMPTIPDKHEVATFAAGCFWCVEVVFDRLDGVHSATSGYIAGHVENPKYKAVCQGVTGHAEAVQVVYDPEKISYETLVSWFWRLHDPTQLNRQGADVGTQYRSGIYYHSDAQKDAAEKSRKVAQGSFSSPIVSEIEKATTFYPAEVSHQDYYKINGSKNPYCRAVITPKLKKLKLE